jgi:hypothetical protein
VLLVVPVARVHHERRAAGQRSVRVRVLGDGGGEGVGGGDPRVEGGVELEDLVPDVVDVVAVEGGVVGAVGEDIAVPLEAGLGLVGGEGGCCELGGC